MRFITEFEMAEGNPRNPDISIKARKDSEEDIGRAIANAFGWENPVNGRSLRHKIAIEAFPMDKWVEFKMALFTELQAHNVDQIKILQLIKELESFGKPSGDAITNQQQ